MTSTSLFVRDERPADADAIHEVIRQAFLVAEHRSGTEQDIVRALRAAGALALGLVVEHGGQLVGHVALSAVRIDGRGQGWFGLGPVAVLPALQGRGVGSQLVRAALDRLRGQGARGCVLLGEPAYYGRFGFRATPGLVLAGVPPEYFLALPFGDDVPKGEVTYHQAFGA